MNPRRKMAVRFWMLLETAAGITQFFFPDLLVIGFATTVGMMILFMELENPESEMDRTIDVFSSHVMLDYIRQLFDENKVFACVFIINNGEWGISRQEESAVLMEMALFLKQLKSGKVFRGTGNDFAIIYPIRHYSEDVVREIYERFILSWHGHAINSTILAIPDSRVALSPDEISQFYQHHRSRAASSEEKMIIFDSKDAAKLQAAKLIQQEISQALEDDRVEVFYQPIYSFEKQRFVSAEALARIRRPDGSIMMPGVFIPIAEKSGLVEAIGVRVFEKVCAMLAEHPITESGVEYIEVNLSVAQCENRWLAEDLAGIIDRFKIPPRLLNLEITETSTIKYRETVIRNMEKLKQLGITFSLDDFGTGESNLNYIVDMPVDIIKFDRSMTQDYFRNDKTKLVMNSVVDMIRNMDLKIVAEGIEDKAQLGAMHKIGIDYIQGYYFSKPLPLIEFLPFIHKRNAGVR
jgi:EAL domain-containing protein (putative c-di-GMP-specific phosphodiesterase class I)